MVAVVHGYCVGVGVLTAASADILVATPDARFVLAEIDNGATAGGVQALRLMPEKRVRAAMMTAEPVLGEELHRLGGVYRLAGTAEHAAEQGRAIAAVIAAKPLAAMSRLKRSLNNTAKAHEVEAAFRAEISYTYELNIMGEAARGRARLHRRRTRRLRPLSAGLSDRRQDASVVLGQDGVDHRARHHLDEPLALSPNLG